MPYRRDPSFKRGHKAAGGSEARYDPCHGDQLPPSLLLGGSRGRTLPAVDPSAHWGMPGSALHGRIGVRPHPEQRQDTFTAFASLNSEVIPGRDHAVSTDAPVLETATGASADLRSRRVRARYANDGKAA